MHRIARRASIGFGAAVGLVAAAAGSGWAVSTHKLAEKHPLPAVSLAVPSDSATLARGAHLVNVVAKCGGCHGAGLAGKLFIDGGPLGVVYSANLTRGRGGVGRDYTDADWVRAIRHGLRRDGTSLLVMPSEDYVLLEEQDLAAIIAYVKQLPPVDHELERTRLRILGHALLAAGQLDILSASNAADVASAAAAGGYGSAVPPGPTKEYGAYLARAGGCIGCHGPGLSGGRHPGQPESEPAAANLTPTGLGTWKEEDFLVAMRTGRRPDGSSITDFMPWRTVGKMSDDELRAIWRFLKTVPPKESGNH